MLFWTNDFFTTNEISNVESFYWPDRENKELEVHFSLSGSVGISLPNAPYSGLIVNDTLDREKLNRAIDDLLSDHKLESLDSLIIKQAPNFYSKNSDLLKKIMNSKNFRACTEINHHILLDDWESGFSKMQLRRVNKCQKHGLSFQKESAESASSIYHFLSNCRAQQGLEMNIEERRFLKLFDELPDKYWIHTIKDADQKLYACLVSIVVSPDVLYTFLPAFDRNHSDLSPLSFLYFNLFPELKSHFFRILDMGISSIDGKPQDSLISYKESIGGIKTQRMTYEIDL